MSAIEEFHSITLKHRGIEERRSQIKLVKAQPAKRLPEGKSKEAFQKMRLVLEGKLNHHVFNAWFKEIMEGSNE